MASYITFGHTGDHKQAELWYWHQDNPTHLVRASPTNLRNNTGTWGFDYTHAKLAGNVSEDWDTARYAQGRVDHSKLKVTLIHKAAFSGSARVVRHLLSRHFPGYDIIDA